MLKIKIIVVAIIGLLLYSNQVEAQYVSTKVNSKHQKYKDSLKQVKERWNGLIGMQYQYNKHWMLRTEGGIIGDRKSILLSINYRFLL